MSFVWFSAPDTTTSVDTTWLWRWTTGTAEAMNYYIKQNVGFQYLIIIMLIGALHILKKTTVFQIVFLQNREPDLKERNCRTRNEVYSKSIPDCQVWQWFEMGLEILASWHDCDKDLIFLLFFNGFHDYIKKQKALNGLNDLININLD